MKGSHKIQAIFIRQQIKVQLKKQRIASVK